MTDFTLIRSDRKTAAIYIRPDSTVEVRAPRAMPRAEIERFVASKEGWIREKRALTQARREERASFSLAYGDTALYFGKEYPVIARPGNRVGFDDAGSCFYMPPDLDSEQIKAACVQVYRLLAKRLLHEKVPYFAEKMGLSPTGITITGAKTRWGSCSSKGSLSFAWRLVMAEEATVDYVVVHELAHLREMNHSERFWRIVAGVLPDYEARRAQLKELQQRLGGEEWET